MKTLLITILALACAQSAAGAATTSANDRGKALFIANNCYLCHGTVGQGGSAGPAIAPPKLMSTYERFAAWVRKPGAGVMPVFTTDVLSDGDLASIYAYLKSLPPPSGVPSVLNGGAPQR